MQQMELVLVGYFLDDNISKTFVKCCKFIKSTLTQIISLSNYKI